MKILRLGIFGKLLFGSPQGEGTTLLCERRKVETTEIQLLFACWCGLIQTDPLVETLKVDESKDQVRETVCTC